MKSYTLGTPEPTKVSMSKWKRGTKRGIDDEAKMGEFMRIYVVLETGCESLNIGDWTHRKYIRIKVN